ncbi:MAG: inosine/xanthosine triphosphatase, partial [Bacteroidota bacterium]
QGACNRAENARILMPEGDFWVGIEGGLEEKNGSFWAFAWMVISNADQSGYGRTAMFSIPPEVSRLIQQGMELGEADDVVFGKENSKQSNGAIGLLTGDAMSRESLYVPALIMALIPFRRPDLFPETQKPY